MCDQSAVFLVVFIFGVMWLSRFRCRADIKCMCGSSRVRSHVCTMSSVQTNTGSQKHQNSCGRSCDESAWPLNIQLEKLFARFILVLKIAGFQALVELGVHIFTDYITSFLNIFMPVNHIHVKCVIITNTKTQLYLMYI